MVEATIDPKYILNIGNRVFETLFPVHYKDPVLVYVELDNNIYRKKGLFFVLLEETFFYSGNVSLGEFSSFEKEYRKINFSKIFKTSLFIELSEVNLKKTDNNYSLYDKLYFDSEKVRFIHEKMNRILKSNDIINEFKLLASKIMEIALKKQKMIFMEHMCVILKDYYIYREYYVYLLKTGKFESSLRFIRKIRELFGLNDFDILNKAYCLKMLGHFEEALIEYSKIPAENREEHVIKDIELCRSIINGK